jgi:hypothetical protein
VTDKNSLTVRSFDGSAVDGTPDTVIEPGELFPAAVVISGNGKCDQICIIIILE